MKNPMKKKHERGQDSYETVDRRLQYKTEIQRNVRYLGICNCIHPLGNWTFYIYCVPFCIST